ncbi:MAG: flagellar basal body rod protein FlgB [Betaproteobacteria bacterium]|nr:flagellar basal body rod protein FlgB [Betaproteobacteria bacterium]
MASGLDAMFGFYQHALDLRVQRQQLLAANIANADTPDYKARDFNFQGALTSAVGATSLPLVTTSSRDLDPPQGAGPAPKLLYRVPLQPSIDGNTVDSDVEMAQFGDNAVRYEAGLTFLTMQIKWMTTAITG